MDSKPISEAQSKLVMKLYPEATWEQVRSMTSYEASEMIKHKLGDSKQDKWQNRSQKPESKPITPPVSSNGARELLIVRQCCLKAAVDACGTLHYDISEDDETLAKDASRILKVAEHFERWVNRI